MAMLDEFPFSDEWKNKSDVLNFVDLIRRLTSFYDMNQYRQYVAQWPVALEALRTLWKAGKVSQLKSPFYEPVEKPKANYV